LKIDLKLKFIEYIWLLCEEEYKKLLSVLTSLAKKGFAYEEYEEELSKKLSMRTNLTEDEEARLIK